jgi:hypothetical protein
MNKYESELKSENSNNSAIMEPDINTDSNNISSTSDISTQ